MRPIHTIRTATLTALGLAVPFAIAGAASIPFANYGGIEDWEPVDEDTLYVQGRTDQWYRAELLGPCIGLEFETAIGFEVTPTGEFDEFSSVIVNGQRCPVQSLTEVAGPPGERRRQQMAEAEAERGTMARYGAPEVDRAVAALGEADREQVRIPFADLGGIESYVAPSNQVLFLEGRNDQWYRAELFGPCPGLQFEQSIGFVFEPTGSFDRFSSVIVDGRECRLRSLTESDAPSGVRQATAPTADQDG